MIESNDLFLLYKKFSACVEQSGWPHLKVVNKCTVRRLLEEMRKYNSIFGDMQATYFQHRMDGLNHW